MTQKIFIWAMMLCAVVAAQAQVAFAAHREEAPTIGDAGSPSGNFATAANLALLAEAQEAARARIITNKRCQRFFNNQGIETMERTRYSFQDFGPGDRVAQVDGYTVFLNMNPQGKFVAPPEGHAGLRTAAEIRGFFILHELGHELSRFTKFCVDHTPSSKFTKLRHDMNDSLLQQHCY